MSDPLTLDRAVDLTRTGDLWLFRGRTVADRAIRTLTNSPVNHVGHGRGHRRPAAADVARRALPGADRRLDGRPPPRRTAARPARGGRPVVGHLRSAGVAATAHARGRPAAGGRADDRPSRASTGCPSPARRRLAGALVPGSRRLRARARAADARCAPSRPTAPRWSRPRCRTWACSRSTGARSGSTPARSGPVTTCPSTTGGPTATRSRSASRQRRPVPSARAPLALTLSTADERCRFPRARIAEACLLHQPPTQWRRR